MAEFKIAADVVSAENERRRAALKSDYEALGDNLSRRGLDIEAVTKKVAEFFVAIPSWARQAHETTGAEDAILFSITDRPVLEALGLYREAVE